MHQPVIGAINGAAIGGGFCLSLATDIRVGLGDRLLPGRRHQQRTDLDRARAELPAAPGHRLVPGLRDHAHRTRRRRRRGRPHRARLARSSRPTNSSTPAYELADRIACFSRPGHRADQAHCCGPASKPAASRATWTPRARPSSSSASPPRTSKRPSGPARRSGPRLPGLTDAGRTARLAGQEVEQQLVHPVGRLELHPVGHARRPARSARARPRGPPSPVICASVRAKSPLPHTPMVGAWTGGSSRGGPTRASGGTLARYQLSAGVSDPFASRSAMTPSASGWPAHDRKLAQSSSDSHCSATPCELEQQHVPRLLPLLEPGGPEGQRDGRPTEPPDGRPGRGRARP